MADIRINGLPLATGPTAPMPADVVALDGTTTRKAPLSVLGDVIRPVATQAEAEAGTNNTKTMTPLTTAQAIAEQAATASQGAKADTALQPGQAATTAQGDKADTAMQPTVYDPTSQNVDSFLKANIIGNPSYQDIYRIRAREVDLEFPDIAAAKTAYGAVSFYPGDQDIDEVRGLIFLNYAPNTDPNNRGQLIVVRQWPSWTYVSWFSIGPASSTTIINRTYDPSKCLLVSRNGSRNLGGWDVTTLPANGALVSPFYTGAVADDIYVYVAGSQDGIYYANQFTPAFGGSSTLTEYAEFDKTFTRTGKKYRFSVDQVGSLTEPARSQNPHMQGMRKLNGVFACSYGGNYNSGSGTATPYQYNGVKILSDNPSPSTIASGLCDPAKMIPILQAKGFTVNRLEAEGAFTTSSGKLYALQVSNWIPGTPGASKLLIFEYFASGKDTIDLSPAAVVENHPMIMPQVGMWGRDGGVYRNPQTGAAWTGVNDICDFLAGPYALAHGITEVDLYRNFLPSGFTDIAGVVYTDATSAFPNASHIQIRSENSTTFHMLVDSSEGREFWIVNGSPRSQNLINHKFKANKNGTNQTGVTSATFTKVTFGTEAWDRGAYYDNTNSRWTPVAGKVQIDCAIEFVGGVVASQIYAICVYKNGALSDIREYHSSSTGNISATIHHEDEANGSDYYEIFAYGGGTGDKTISGSISRSYFSGGKL